jgi:hypothetical protein
MTIMPKLAISVLPSEKRLDALTDAARQRAFDEAVDLVETWESEVSRRKSDVTSLLLYSPRVALAVGTSITG